MSVTYIQSTSSQYTEKKLSDKVFSKAAAELVNSGLVLTSHNHWRASAPETKYGLTDEETTKTVYHVTINDTFALTTKFKSDARLWKESLTENGFDCDYTVEDTQTTKQIWGQPNGTALFIDPNAHDWVGKCNVLSLVYDDGISLTPTLRNAADGVWLEFTIAWNREKVARQTDIKSLMIDKTLADLGMITSIVEDVIGVTTPITEDCNFRCETISESQCTPDIIAMRRQAVIDARNVAQEEE